MLGLVLADINQPLFPQFALNIEEVAGEMGYGVLIGNSRGDPQEQERAIRRLIERGADGIIVVPRYGTRVTGSSLAHCRHRFPVIARQHGCGGPFRRRFDHGPASA